MPSGIRLISALVLFCWSSCFGQSVLSVSSASGTPGGQVSLNLSINTAYSGSSAGLQWTLNAPGPEVTSFTTIAGPAAVAAQKSLYCANQICLLAGSNSNPLSDGVIATVTFTLSPEATGNLAVQLSNPVEALLDGTGGSITAANGVISIVAISVTATPTAATLQSGQSIQLSAAVAGSTNSNVTWSMAPMVGSLSSSGLYTAPSTIAGTQTVVVTATSIADPTKSAGVTITLVPVSVILSPSSASLSAAQTQQFTAAVSNTGNEGVTWSLSPAVGTISNGLYTAPVSIPSNQTVSVIASSVVDPTKVAVATVTLIASESVSLSPASATLHASQTAQFTLTVANTTNSGVTWSLTPAIGAVSNGLYTAPESIASAQTVTITAASIADPSKSASSEVYLLPPVAVTLSPATISLKAGQTTLFTANVGNASISAVSWSLHPDVGTISNGEYTAPLRISESQTVTVTATSGADASKSATAVVTLVPGAIQRRRGLVPR